MTLSYQDIYEFFMPKVNDYGLAQLLEVDMETSNEMLRDWMIGAIAIPQCRKLFAEIKANDDIHELQVTLKQEVDGYSDFLFVCDIITEGMVIKWLQPKVHSTLNTNQFFGGKEEKFYSQANHSQRLSDMLKDANRNFKKIIRDYNYINMAHKTGVE